MRYSLDGTDWQVMGLVPSEWVWRKIGSADADLDNLQPPTPAWIPATVPGDVQSDLLDTGAYPEPWRDLNSLYWEWTSQRDWVYRKPFDLPATEATRATLQFEGVDYSCHVFLNGHKLGSHAGTYTPFELDAGEAVRWGASNELVVVVEHAPFEPDQQAQIGYTSRVRLWKPRFAYQWDWCTRLVPLGIHESVQLDTWHTARLAGVRARPEVTHVEGTVGSARLDLAADVDCDGTADLEIEADLSAPDGSVIARTSQATSYERAGRRRTLLTMSIDRVSLWFPNGQGDQPLYILRTRLRTASGDMLDERASRVGFRRIEAVSNEGAPSDALPYTLRVNGRRTYLKGWNWAPIDQLYGRHKPERYRHAIRVAGEAHCNLLRVWGGGLLEREYFYDLCDEAGILVWQEFHQSSSGIDNQPALDEDYVSYCRDQASQIVPRRANHPSLAIWCGGNELMSSDWRPNGLDHPVLAALRDVVREEDPTRIYYPTSPSGPVFAASPDNVGKMHDVHGNWLYMGDPDHYAFCNGIDPLLHSEFGAEGAANIQTLRAFLSEPNLWPPDRSNPAWVHHGAWWLHRDKVEAIFGRIDDLETFVEASQWIQFEGLRYLAESNRRRKWRTSGSAPWQLNEAWPNASCTNCLEYFGAVKPAYWAMRTAYAPVLISARYDRLRHQPGDVISAALWLNVSDPRLAPASVAWTWADLESGTVISAGSAACPTFSDAAAAPVADVRLDTPNRAGIFGLLVTAGAYENRYVFSTCDAPILARLLDLAQQTPAVEMLGGGKLRIHAADTGGTVAGLRIAALGGYEGPYLDRGYVPFALPGELFEVTLAGRGQITVGAWNVPTQTYEVPPQSL